MIALIHQVAEPKPRPRGPYQVASLKVDVAGTNDI
jgi:hypothetical protein